MATNPVVSSKQVEEVVQGVRTEVVCTAFANMILVVVTQYGKMGTLVSVEPSMVADGISSPQLTTKVLLGKDEPLVHICAKHLVTSVSQEAGNKSILLAMALKDKSIEGIRTLQTLIHRCRAGQMVLMLTVNHSKQEMVKALLSCGADINMQDQEGLTLYVCL